jgi:superfamily II DNA or RNA helicase
MPLLIKLKGQFGPAIRARGMQYYRAGRVKIQEGSADRVTALVSGSRRYDVELSFKGSVLHASCECPYAENDLCKHIWATLLAAEHNHFLGKTENSRSVQAELESDDNDYSDEESLFGDDDNNDGIDIPAATSSRRVPSPQQTIQPVKKADSKTPDWKILFQDVGTASNAYQFQYGSGEWPQNRELVYVIDFAESRRTGKLRVDALYRDRRKNGIWGVLKPLRLPSYQAGLIPGAVDRRIMGILLGAQNPDGFGLYYGYALQYGAPHRYAVPESLFETLLPLMAESGHVYLKANEKQEFREPFQWDGGAPWIFRIEVRSGENGGFTLSGHLCRNGAVMPLDAPELLLSDGLVFHGNTAARLEHNGCFQWIAALSKSGPVALPADEIQEWLAVLYSQPQAPPLLLPENVKPEEISPSPSFRFLIRKPKPLNYYPSVMQNLQGELSFEYEDTVTTYGQGGHGIYDKEARRLIKRDRAREEAAAETLTRLGLKRQNFQNIGTLFEITSKRLPTVVRELVKEGWRVEAEGRLYHQAGAIRIEVRSGIDWFELEGSIAFGDKEASFPALLAALKRKESVVTLGDGTFGVIPEEWLRKYGLLAGLGRAEDDTIRFTRSQAGLLDALLAAQPDAVCDAAFEHARSRLRSFDGIATAVAPEGFVGELRHYQNDGLGWLHFLRDFGLGGCLADDMGLGKTVQVLALLESRRRLREESAKESAEVGKGKRKSNRTQITGGKRPSRYGVKDVSAESPPPSLVVAPRSLIFNWMQEAARFTPGLKVLDYTGLERLAAADRFDEYDLVLTTYGTLRRDILRLKDFRFDYAILDESQAIKNSASSSAKAARLLSADHRLAMSGTPIENHLGELWSLFEFLNPGMLGAASMFKLEGLGGRNPAPETRELLARVLRPYILRRTKKQVAKELPDKVEQTIYCELDGEQRKYYNELRDYYRESLLRRIETNGIQKSKFLVLEALLRLRQAACHPGLLDGEKMNSSSAKLETLLPQLAEVQEEGHKVLVFSQFTSFLAIVRKHLERGKMSYLYLDGKTRDRGALVDKFQNDPASMLFLISLKAGGLGLNLTAAEYVYLLDPWWNPAVEAQAIDRTHRIGQSRQVFAYRLIAKDTVEEKVLELQKEKRLLADAILQQDNSLLRTLRREDLELLLS